MNEPDATRPPAGGDDPAAHAGGGEPRRDERGDDARPGELHLDERDGYARPGEPRRDERGGDARPRDPRVIAGFAIGCGAVFVATVGVYWNYWQPAAATWLWAGGSFAIGAVLGAAWAALRGARL
jgi:hypothetical protein